jgi:cytoskeletal protein RodZ
MFVFETNPGGSLGNSPGTGEVVAELSPREEGWSGLDVEQTLGQLMTETRKQMGISRDQVSEQTHIPAYYVRMIESDSYDAIPDQLYLLPFFRRYADFLGLDARKVVSRFILDFEKAENEVVATPAATAYSKALSKWRQIAVAAIAGAILLPCIAWGVGAMRAMSLSPHTRPSIASGSTPARALAVEEAAQRPSPAVAAPAAVPIALADTNSGAQIAPQQPAPTKARRAGRRHKLLRHSRRWKQKHLT